MSKYLSNRQKNLKIGIASYTENQTVLEITGNVGIKTNNATSELYVVGNGYFTGIVTASNFDGNVSYATYADNAGIASVAGVATYSQYSGIATYASVAGISTYATNSGIASFASVAGVVTYSQYSGIATYADYAGIATYASVAGIATYADNAGIATYADNAGIATYADNAGIATYATSSGIATYATNAGIATYATSSGIATYADNAGIATYATSSGIATYADNAGIATYATNAGIATYSVSSDYSNTSGFSTSSNIASYASVSGVATALQNTRTFEIQGDVVSLPIDFNGTQNVVLTVEIQPNSVGLGSDTTGDYVETISGTPNQINVSGGTGEGSNPVISIADNPTLPGSVTIANDLQVNNNLNVTGNITVGGTAGYILVENFRVSDADIVLGFTTDSQNNDVSTDITANHGGIAVASTEGNPLVTLSVIGIETLPATYKKIMWFKAGAFAGLNTDAWLINYAVGIGSTQFPSGTRLAAGSVQFTEQDLAVVRNINASGIVTAGGGFVGSLTGTATTALNLSDAANITTGTISNQRLSGTYNIDVIGTATTAIDVIGGIGSISSLTVSGVTTTGLLNVGVGGTIITTTSIGSVGIGSTQPTATFDVIGTAKISDNITLGSNKTVSSTGGLTISNTTGVLTITSGGTGGNVNISGLSNFIGNGSGSLQAGSFTGRNANVFTANGSNLTVAGGNAIAPSNNANIVNGGNLFLKSGQGGGLSGNAGDVYIDGGGTNGGSGTVGNVLIGTQVSSNVGIGSTLPGSTLVVSSPSGYKTNLLELNSKDGAPLRITNTARAGYSIETYDIAGSFTPTLTFRFAPNGSLTNSGIGIWNNGSTSVVIGYGTGLGPYSSGYVALDGNTTKVKSLGFRDIATLTADVVLERDDADVLAQRRSGIGQTFRIYNTYTSASQYERAYLGWNNNVFQIGVDTAGISTARQMEFQTNGTTRVAITTTGLVGIGTTNPSAKLDINAGIAITATNSSTLNITQTWNNASQTFTAINANITDTASSSGFLMKLDRNNYPGFRVVTSKVQEGGAAIRVHYRQASIFDNYVELGPNGGNYTLGLIANTANNGATTLLQFQSGRIALPETQFLGFGPDASFNGYGGFPLIGYDSSSGALAQRNGVTPQTYRIYNTFTSSTNFERGSLGWSNNVFRIGTEKGTAGGTARQLELQTDGTTRVAITTDGFIDGTAFQSYELDDISTATDGQENTFVPRFNYDRVTITNPFRLTITVNGIPQSAFINNTDYVYQSNFLGSNNGYTIDTDNNIKFTESIPTGSEIVARVLPVSNTATRIKFYPFKPADILLGY